MDIRHLCSIVFVGGEFNPLMFDERKLFGGRIDPEKLAVGPIAQFSYDSGVYRFSVTPDRIDVQYRGQEVMPPQLLDAGQAVGQMIENSSRPTSVNGLGLNCDTVFPQDMLGQTGDEFCSQLVNNRAIELIGPGEGDHVACLASVIFGKNNMRYQIKVEPEANSSGKNLFVAINLHRVVNQQEGLSIQESDIDAFRSYVRGLHSRINLVNKNGRRLNTV